MTGALGAWNWRTLLGQRSEPSWTAGPTGMAWDVVERVGWGQPEGTGAAAPGGWDEAGAEEEPTARLP